MINFLFLGTLLIMSLSVNAESFNIEITNTQTKVTSPKVELNPVSITIKNSTDLKIISEIRSKEKVLSRFVVEGGKSQTIQLKLPESKILYYVSLSPPAQALELKFNQEDYAVPE